MSVRTLAALTASLALVSGGGMLGVAEASPAVSRSQAAPVVVTIDSSRTVTMPATVQPGVNEFQVTSARASSFQIVQPAEGYTPEQAAADVKNGLNQGKAKAIRRFERNITLLGGATSRPGDPASVWVDLPAGTYWALDVRNGKASAFVPFTASGVDTGATMPTGPKLKAVQSTTWARKPARIPKKGLLTFKNFSDRNHFIVMAEMKPGATIKDLRAWVRAAMQGEEGPPPLKFGSGMDSGVLSGGHTMAFDYSLSKGTYAVLCFWPDASMGGMPHAFMGMIRTIRVGGGGSGS
jgi:hypothetical protein